MSKQLFAFIVGVSISSAWWLGATQHWKQDMQWALPAIATFLFVLIAAAWLVDNWHE